MGVARENRCQPSPCHILQEQYYCERCKRKIDCEKRILFKDCCCREWYGLGPQVHLQVQVLSTCTIHCQKAHWANMGLSENRVYSQWNSHLIGIMISKTIGFRGLAYFQTNPYNTFIQIWHAKTRFSSLCTLAKLCEENILRKWWREHILKSVYHSSDKPDMLQDMLQQYWISVLIFHTFPHLSLVDVHPFTIHQCLVVDIQLLVVSPFLWEKNDFSLHKSLFSWPNWGPPGDSLHSSEALQIW